MKVLLLAIAACSVALCGCATSGNLDPLAMAMVMDSCCGNCMPGDVCCGNCDVTTLARADGCCGNCGSDGATQVAVNADGCCGSCSLAGK